MTHSGAGTLLKDPSRPDPEPWEWNKFPDGEVQPSHDERMAVFVHLGADDKHARRYLDYLKTRTYMVSSWRRRPWSPELVAELQASGLTVRDMPAEVKDDKRAGLSKDWAPFWYPGSQAFAKPGSSATTTSTSTSTSNAAANTPARGTTAPPAPFVQRYARAVKRRAKGIARGAKQGWYDAEPQARKAARAAQARRP